MGDTPSEFSEYFELLRTRELVSQRFFVTQNSSILQRTPHSRSQTRDAVFQNIVCGTISQGIHCGLLADDSRNDEKGHIRFHLLCESQGIQSITAWQREIG